MEIKVSQVDRSGGTVNVGDEFWAYMITPSFSPPTKVRVVKDTSAENLECGRDYDVEDKEGKRLWNAYMILAYGDRAAEGETERSYHRKKIMEWINFDYGNKRN